MVHLYVVCRWIPRLESSCRCVVELTALKNTVSGLRAERYSRDNESHETQLTKVGLNEQSVRHHHIHCRVITMVTCIAVGLDDARVPSGVSSYQAVDGYWFPGQ